MTSLIRLQLCYISSQKSILLFVILQIIGFTFIEYHRNKYNHSHIYFNHFFLTEILPDALKTECSKCTQVQKDKAKKVIKFLIKNKPDMFKELEDIYDPTHEYRTRYADKLKAEGLEFPN